MNTIRTIIAAAMLSTLSLGYLTAAQATETVKPLQGVSFHTETKDAVAYYLADKGTCNVVLTLTDKIAYAPVRFEAAIADGSSKQYPFVEGTTLEFACHDRGQAMTINTLEDVAIGR